jgi:ABC-2 type transport system ATP-binding protein
MNSIVSIKGLQKNYGNQIALNNIDLDLEKGRIYGLIGPNGAGKTTLLKAILGLAKADGKVQVFGLDPFKDRTSVLLDVSFIADTAVLPRWIKVSQAIEYMEAVHPKFSRQK